MKKMLSLLTVSVFAVMTTGAALPSEQTQNTPPPDMIARHDQDGDNRVSKDEFPGPDEHFARIDLDGDGYVSRDEAKKAPGPSGRSGGVPKKFQEDDADGDGVVSRSEFSGPSEHFDRLDLNGDGAIEESEARQGPPGMSGQNRKTAQGE